MTMLLDDPRSDLLVVEALTITHRSSEQGRTLVRDVSFTVAAGETVGLVGESGSGKSMTARALLSLLPPGVSADGSATVAGRQLIGRPEREVRHLRGSFLTLAMQDPFTVLNPLRTVSAHIAETLQGVPSTHRPTRHEVREEITRRLAEVGITDPDVADRYPFQISGGMSQRVALAAALVKEPRLLIADEPTSALDTTTQRDILVLLKNVLAKRGMGLLFITHDLHAAFAVCDRVLVMYAGSLLENGPARRIADAPAHPYTHGLLRAIPSVQRRQPQLVGIPGTVPNPDEVTQRCPFEPRCAWAAAPCRDGSPRFRKIAPRHLTACVRYGEIAAELGTAPPEAATARPPAGRAASTPVMVASSVSKIYRTRRGRVGAKALTNVSLEVFAGERVGLVGESGSGKSTLARCLLGLETPTEGSIIADDIDVSDYARLSRAANRRVRRLVQCVFQDPYSSLNPAHSVSFAVNEALGQRAERPGDPLAEVKRLLGLVGLPEDLLSQRPAALSGGQRQRVAIARALAVEPRLLICDEPVSALDVSVQAQVLEVLRRVNQQLGTALLFISHDLGVVRQVTDRLLVLRDGEVVEAGDTEQVLDTPEHPYTVRLIEAAPGASAPDAVRLPAVDQLPQLGRQA